MTTHNKKAARPRAAPTDPAVSPAPHPVSPARLVIQASAGTGKTFQLSNRYLSLVRHVSPDRILATTFTRKAAGEILQRILLRLARGGLSADEAQKLVPFLGEPAITQEECLNLLVSVTKQLHRLQIGTIDSFFARLTTVAALELGLSPQWRLLDGSELAPLRDQAIEIVLQQGHHLDLLRLVHMLDPGQRRSSVQRTISTKVDQFHGIYCRAPREAWEPFPPPRLLTVEQRQELLAELRGFELHPTLAKARNTDCDRFESEDWDAAISKGIFSKVAAGEETFNRHTIPPEARRIYERLLDHATSFNLLAWANQTLAVRQLLERYDAALNDCKRDAGAIYFNDITRLLVRELNQVSVSLKHRLDVWFEHLLLDEFQDTSVEQWRVLRPFALSACENPSGSFFCVGDAKQAIYAWRDGQAALLKNLTQDLPGLSEQQLATSYRSSPVIMQVVNQVFQGICQYPHFGERTNAVQEWVRGFPQHDTARKHLPGYAVLLSPPLPPEVEATTRQTTLLDREVLRYAARYIARLRRLAPHQSIGVLVRSNASINTLILELGQLGILASEEGGNPLTDSAAVDAILALLQMVDHPGNTIARFHVARSPLGPLLGYVDAQDDASTWQFVRTIRRQLVRAGYGETINPWAARLASACSPRELRRLQQLCSLADAYDARSTLRTSDFIDYVSRTKVQESTPAPVRVMTIHAAKGLEFDNVVLPELDEKLWKPPAYVAGAQSAFDPPHTVAIYKGEAKSLGSPESIQQAVQQTIDAQWNDSLSVLYVALTRAVHSLHMLIRPSAKTGEHIETTLAGLLRAALAPDRPATADQVLFEVGDAQWYGTESPVPAGESPHVAEDEVSRLPHRSSLQIRLATSPDGASRHLERVSPSRHDAHREFTLTNVLSSSNSTGMERGTLFHRWLEHLQWLDHGFPERSVLRRLSQPFTKGPVDLERTIDEFEKQLQAPEVVRVLSQQSYREGWKLGVADTVLSELTSGPIQLTVATERRIVVQQSGTLVSGTIDRLVLISRDGRLLAVDILDYKTDSPSEDGAPSPRLADYRDQLRAYVQAICLIYRLEPDRISSRLIMLSSGQVVPC